MTPEAALRAMRAAADSARAPEMAAYHKVERPYLGMAAPAMEPLIAAWRAALDVPGRVALAHGLWASNVHEARIAAAKLLTQARIREQEAVVWAELAGWVPDFDSGAIADHACKAIDRRLVAEPVRLDEVEVWTTDANLWVRRAALVATLPWTRHRYPTPEESAARERILGWAALYVPDRDWFIQKAVGWWLRSLAARDPVRVAAFLDGPGAGLKAFARREAERSGI